MKLRRSIYPSIAWLLLIWILSSIPSKNLPGIQVLGIDKLAHVCVYFILGLLCNLWLKSLHCKTYQVVFFYSLLLLTATADEFHQYYIPGRSVVVYDLMANGLGLVLAMGLYLKKHD